MEKEPLCLYRVQDQRWETFDSYFCLGGKCLGGSRPNFDEITRLSLLGWSIICRLDELAWVFPSSSCSYLWFHYLLSTVVVHCIIIFLNVFLTSSSQIIMYFFHLRTLCVIFYLDFCNWLILVVYPWSNYLNLSFYFRITPLYFTMTSFLFFSFLTVAK